MSLFKGSILKGNESSEPTTNFQYVNTWGKDDVTFHADFLFQTWSLSKSVSLKNQESSRKGYISSHIMHDIFIWIKIQNWGFMGDFGHVCPIEELTPFICFDDFLIVITTPNR